MNAAYINQLTSLREQIIQVTAKENTNTINIDAQTVLSLINNALDYELYITIANDNLKGVQTILN